MKHIYIHTPLLPEADYRLVLERLCPDSVKNITVHTHVPADITPRQLQSVVAVQKAFRPDQSLRFRNCLVFDRLPRFSRVLCRTLRKNSFSVELQVQKEQAPRLARLARRLEKAGIRYTLSLEESQDQPGVYRLFAGLGLHVCFTEPRYTAETPDWFDRWLYDPAAQAVNTFCDIINMLVLQTHSPNCRHASCFGNTFRVDEALKVYLCPIHRDARTMLGSLQEAESPAALLNCEAVAKLLPAAVRKRRSCDAGCPTFPYCQGGCPLEAEANRDCAHYSATVERIRQRLLEVYRDGSVRQVNYVVKNAILNALAFGTAFFN